MVELAKSGNNSFQGEGTIPEGKIFKEENIDARKRTEEENIDEGMRNTEDVDEPKKITQSTIDFISREQKFVSVMVCLLFDYCCIILKLNIALFTRCYNANNEIGWNGV